MRALVISIVIAVALAAAGGVCLSFADAERRVAAQEEQLATLQYQDAADGPTDLGAVVRSASGLPLVGSGLEDDAHALRTNGEYWLARYEPVAKERGGPLGELAANAAFRAAQVEPDRPTAVRRLQEVIKEYAEVLKARPGHEDAAYNYEFAVRFREALSRAKPPANAAKVAAADTTPLTIHGRPGAPPKGVSMSNFKVMVPKRGDEREDSQDAGKGNQKVRKG